MKKSLVRLKEGYNNPVWYDPISREFFSEDGSKIDCVPDWAKAEAKKVKTGERKKREIVKMDDRPIIVDSSGVKENPSPKEVSMIKKMGF